MPLEHSSSSAPPDGSVPILLRIGEVFLKGKNRGIFFKQLVRNTRSALADLEDVVVEPMHLRPVVWHPPELRRKVHSRLARVFGIQSLSPAVLVERDLDAIAEVAISQAKTFPPGTSFKIETKRNDKKFPIPSMKLSAEVGGRVIEQTGLPVDVHRPDRTIFVEIGHRTAFVFCERIEGPGGLPVGSSGTLTLLLSGGIDSPVAGWSAMRRGCTINAVYFHSFPYTGDKTKEKVLRLAQLLARFQGRMAVNVVHFTEVQKQLRDNRRDDLVVLLYRRMMVRVAAAIAQKEEAKALVTGENLGQVASQTIENIGVIQSATPMTILRPLIAFDKREIIAKAREIGTYETSIEPYEDSCSLFVPDNPATRARPRDLEKAERDLDIDALVQQLCQGTERIVVS